MEIETCGLAPRSDREIKRLARSYEIIAQHRMRNHVAPSQHLGRLGLFGQFLEWQFLPHYMGGPPRWKVSFRRRFGKRTLPDFAVVGPIKCGSSDFCTQLFRHPCILPPLTKEISTADPEAWRPHYPTVREKERVAAKYGAALSGYLGPFLPWLQLPESYHRARPDGKVIIMLRDPVSRGYSQWKWEYLVNGGRRRRRVIKPFPTFKAFVDSNLAVFPAFAMDMFWTSPFPHSGIYHTFVKFWIDTFGRDNVLILKVEDYFQDRSRSLVEAYEFLGLPALSLPEIDFRVNENPLQLPPPDEESLQKLSDFYRPYNEQLWDVLGKELDWS